jgi:hypothetical protein
MMGGLENGPVMCPSIRRIYLERSGRLTVAKTKKWTSKRDGRVTKMIHTVILSFFILTILSLSVLGESTTMYTPPSPENPILIKKIVTPVESGKNIGNMLRIWVEITPRIEHIASMQINEIIDDSFQIVRINESEVVPIHSMILKSQHDISSFRLAQIRGDKNLEENFEHKFLADAYYKYRIKADYDIFFFFLSNLDNTPENVKNILNYLYYDFDILWAEPYRAYVAVNYGNHSDVIYTFSDADQNDWAELRVDDIKTNGTAYLKISDNRNYSLQFNTTKENKQLFDYAGIFRLNVSHLSINERLYYWYYVKPKRSGISITESTISIDRMPEISYPLEIDVQKPDMKFEVSPIPETYQVYAAKGWWNPFFQDKLKLEYKITYSGNASKEYLDKIKIMFEKPEGGHFSYIEGIRPTGVCVLNFSSYRTTTIDANIEYNSTGEFQIPGIVIEGELYKKPNQNIKVDDPISRNRDLIITYITSIISFLLGFVFREELAEKIKSALRYLRLRIFKKKDSPQGDHTLQEDYIQ